MMFVRKRKFCYCKIMREGANSHQESPLVGDSESPTAVESSGVPSERVQGRFGRVALAIIAVAAFAVVAKGSKGEEEDHSPTDAEKEADEGLAAALELFKNASEYTKNQVRGNFGKDWKKN